MPGFKRNTRVNIDYIDSEEIEKQGAELLKNVMLF